MQVIYFNCFFPYERQNSIEYYQGFMIERARKQTHEVLGGPVLKKVGNLFLQQHFCPMTTLKYFGQHDVQGLESAG